jgi:hypothetical protein
MQTLVNERHVKLTRQFQIVEAGLDSSDLAFMPHSPFFDKFNELRINVYRSNFGTYLKSLEILVKSGALVPHFVNKRNKRVQALRPKIRKSFHVDFFHNPPINLQGVPILNDGCINQINCQCARKKSIIAGVVLKYLNGFLIVINKIYAAEIANSSLL